MPSTMWIAPPLPPALLLSNTTLVRFTSGALTMASAAPLPLPSLGLASFCAMLFLNVTLLALSDPPLW